MKKHEVILIVWDFNAKVGRQETDDTTEKFGLGVKNKRHW